MKAEDIKTWDDFLGAVKKLKAAGITPIVVGAGEKWPMHFYYSYLVMRIGGEHALADAKAGKDGGFKNATFVEAGKRLRELAALEPFQPGYLLDHARAVGRHFRRRQGGDGSDGRMAARHAGAEFGQRQGPAPEDDIGIFSFPVVPGGKGKATDTLGGINGCLVTKTAPPEAVDFLKFFSQEKYAKEAAAKAAYIPVYKGAEAAIKDPLVKQVGDDLAATTYHQNFFDQDLGPSVGRVINDISVCGRRGRNDAGSGGRGDPGRGRPAIAVPGPRTARLGPADEVRRGQCAPLDPAP